MLVLFSDIPAHVVTSYTTWLGVLQKIHVLAPAWGKKILKYQGAETVVFHGKFRGRKNIVSLPDAQYFSGKNWHSHTRRLKHFGLYLQQWLGIACLESRGLQEH